MNLTCKNIPILSALICFAGVIFAQESTRGETIQRPRGFLFDPGFEIYRGNGKPLGARTSFDPESKADVNAHVTYYVDVSKGKNTNDGLSRKKPFKSLWCALQKKGSKKIVIKEGRYDYEDGWKGVVSSGTLSLRASGGTAIISTHIPVKFKRFEGDTYKATKIHQERWGNVVDLSQQLQHRVLKKVDRLPIEPGQYYVDKNDLYVATLDKREPDTKILTLLAESSKTPIILASSYLEDIEFWGGVNCLRIRIPEKDVVVLNQVTGRYSHGGTGFQLNVAGHGILYRCKGFNNYSDDFNWHNYQGKSGTAVEINTVSRYAGTNNASCTANASSAHDEIKLIRINGDYRFAQNRVVADVGKAQTWNIACIAQSSRHDDDRTSWWSQNWSFAEDVTAWVDTCVGSNKDDTSKRGWSSEKNARVYFHNTDFVSGDVRFKRGAARY